MPVSRFIPAFTFAEDRLAALKALAPEAFNADGRLDWDALKIALGEAIDDGATESFGLNWPGKRLARRLALTPVHKTLAPAPGEGVDEASTRNIFIEGDNLDALKLLRKAYAGRVKMIYIDPPYNTGNDLIYKDDFRESVEDYQQKTGQRDEEGARLVANPKSGGRFHSNWLNMIYPRLLLARDLLREDGVIFVSIDDNEVHNLRQAMDEVFGPENFEATIVWQKVYSPRMDDDGISPDHDFILAYGASSELVPSRRPFKQNEKQFTGVDEKTGLKYRPRSLRKEGKNSRREDRPNLFYAITAPSGQSVLPMRSDGTEGRWRMQRSKYERLLSEGLIEWVKVKDRWQPYVRQILDDRSTKPYVTIWPHTEVGHNHEAVDDLKGVLGEAVFDNPKPLRLIRRAIKIAIPAVDVEADPIDDDDGDDIVLDFFSGSGTTAQAVLESNVEDGTRLRFVLVQMPESVDNPKYRNIAEIGKERLRYAIKRLTSNKQAAVYTMNQARLGLEPYTVPNVPLDLGFKVFKIEDSPFKRWADYEGEDIPAYQARLDEAADHPLRPGWVPEAVLTEIALQEGFPLDSAMAVVPEFKRNVVRRVSHESSQHRLFVCLDERIYADTIANVHLGDQDIFICFDHALGDEAKLRLADACKVKVI